MNVPTSYTEVKACKKQLYAYAFSLFCLIGTVKSRFYKSSARRCLYLSIRRSRSFCNLSKKHLPLMNETADCPIRVSTLYSCFFICFLFTTAFRPRQEAIEVEHRKTFTNLNNNSSSEAPANHLNCTDMFCLIFFW